MLSSSSPICSLSSNSTTSRRVTPRLRHRPDHATHWRDEYAAAQRENPQIDYADSLDDKRTPLDTSYIPDIIARYQNLAGEQDRKRTAQSFLVPREEIAAQGYDLSINKYKEIEYEKIDYPAPEEIIAELEQLDSDYRAGLAALKAML